MFKIIGADQKEYGPVSADQIRQWITEGRVNGQTKVCAEGTQDWKPLEMFPDFGLTAGPAPAGIPGSVVEAPVSREEILARDYSLDIISCFSRGWDLFKNNFAILFVTFLLLVVLAVAVSGAVQLVFAGIGVNRLPFASKIYLGPLYIIFNALVLGPAMGGFYHVYLATLRGQPANAGDLFIGFKSFQDLFLGKLIPGLVAALCMLPYNIVSSAKMAPFFDHLQQNPSAVKPQEIISTLVSGYTSSPVLFFVCLVVTMYLTVNWQFTLPLIVDKKMGFWTAMSTSWRIVHKHWFHVFGLLVLMGLLNVAGLCMCCVGLLFTIPLGLTALVYAYEDIFVRKVA